MGKSADSALVQLGCVFRGREPLMAHPVIRDTCFSSDPTSGSMLISFFPVSFSWQGISQWLPSWLCLRLHGVLLLGVPDCSTSTATSRLTFFFIFWSSSQQPSVTTSRSWLTFMPVKPSSFCSLCQMSPSACLIKAALTILCFLASEREKYSLGIQSTVKVLCVSPIFQKGIRECFGGMPMKIYFPLILPTSKSD